jgi:hypothetical protein
MTTCSAMTAESCKGPHQIGIRLRYGVKGSGLARWPESA